MNLFMAAGMDLPSSGASRTRLSTRMPRQPLFAEKAVDEALRLSAIEPTEEQLALAAAYAKRARDAKFRGQRETAVRNIFFDEIMTGVLGYRRYSADEEYNLAFERQLRRKSVDVALGRFFPDGAGDEVIAPFEMKGPDTFDLDKIMPGRGLSPVQQAWDYAADAPGARWVLVSNCVEIRLYRFGRGRDAYELFDLSRLDQRDELRRLLLILDAKRLLGPDTDALLAQSDAALKEITEELYVDYKLLRGELVGFLHDSADGPKLALGQAIETAQKLLDRVIFIAFASGNGMLPQTIFQRAVGFRNEFDPRPVWQNVNRLFRWVDKGNPASNPLNDVWPYNGGLFAEDPVADKVVLPDHLAERMAGLLEWDYGSEVSVNVLGHIFEQSIGDLEKLREGEPAAVSQRKREGVVYTPEYVTRFLVERTIGETLRERFAALLPRHVGVIAYASQSHVAHSGTPPASPSRGGQSQMTSSPPPALRATSPVEGEEGGELGALPPLDGEGASPPGLAFGQPEDRRREAGGVAGTALWPNEERETAFWKDYLTALTELTVVDPACGSGAFLVAAFDALAAEYRRVTERLADLGVEAKLDIYDTILTSNLYGVDLNVESAEITRLALWLKTARRQHRLAKLDQTIRDGNSLIDDPKASDRAFDWRAAFADVFAKGGFDIVIGNPPYVRMEHLKPVKPWLAEHYTVADERTDLSAYFFEKGVRLLKPGGRLGYISTSSFFRAGYGERLRLLLSEYTDIEAVVDFGDVQIFEGVTTYPAIVTARKRPTLRPFDKLTAQGALRQAQDAGPSTLRQAQGEGRGELRFLNIGASAPDDIETAFGALAQPMDRARLTGGSWQFEDDALARLRDKIVTGRKTLGEVYGAPLYGIKTGLNEAFVIDTETRDRLVDADPKSADLLKPFLKGENIKRWRVEPEGLWLINTPRGKVDIEAYPAVRDWLLPFKDRLEGRATQQEWWELQQAQLAYQGAFEGRKIAYQDICNSNPFTLDPDGHYLANTCYFIPSDDAALLAYLNSKAAWFFWSAITNIARGGYLRLRTDFVELTPLPALPSELRAQADAATKAAASRNGASEAFLHRLVTDLGRTGAALSRKLRDFHELDFTAFRAEVKRALKVEIPVRERAEWEALHAGASAEVRRLSGEIEAAEREIDRLVYAAFGLTGEEIALLETSLEGQV